MSVTSGAWFGRDEVALHRCLWDANRDLAEACRRHPFIRELEAGTLSPVVFRRYVAQDAFYLHAFLKAYALGLARCDDQDSAEKFLDLAAGVLHELRLHRDYARELGIELETVLPNPTTLAYTDFLLATAWHRSLGELLAAMTPCMRLYAWLGQQLAPSAAQPNPYERWIRTYSAPEFERLATCIEELLDRHAADAPDVRDAYRYAMECELAFFSAVMS